MKVAVVGGGMLGLTLAWRLAARGHAVEVLEAEPRLGGLAGPQDYGPFVWDRFYHCILPQDTRLIDLLGELGLAEELRWTRTGTGYYARGRFIDMNGNKDFLKFPLLGLWSKARLAWMVVWATRFADPDRLYEVSAEKWLTDLCGKAAYEIFWQPLLKAKFGPFHDQVAAVFIYATLKRMFGARSAAAGAENLGYVRGGYARILSRFDERLRGKGVTIRTSAPVASIAPGEGGTGCRVARRGPDGKESVDSYDEVWFTAPTRLAKKVVSPEYLGTVDAFDRANPTSAAYLGVACLVLALEKPLTPYYVLNIGESAVELTGLIEMTNLVDPKTETAGLSLVYLPRYMDSESPEFQASDASLRESLIVRGLQRLFPDFDPARARYCGIHRARYVQPLPLVRHAGAESAGPPSPSAGPFRIVNTTMLRCATLNNNEVVGLVDRTLGLTP